MDGGLSEINIVIGITREPRHEMSLIFSFENLTGSFDTLEGGSERRVRLDWKKGEGVSWKKSV